MNRKNYFVNLFLVIGLASYLMSCDDENEAASTGRAEVKITDAAIDAENITGVFLRVKEVQAHGQNETKTVATFDDPQTFNVMDFQNGATYDLGGGDLEAGSYSELRLILEEGSYVEFEDGSTEELTIPSGASSGYKVKGDYEIAANSTSELVVDIDLRKAFVKTGTGAYMLRPTARLVIEETASVIQGTVSGNTEDRVVIYAYAKGTYTASEAAEPGEGSTRFEGSVNSAVVTNNTFTLAFMEPGEYDLIAVAYVENEDGETYEFRSATQAEVLINGSLLGVLELESNTTLNVLINLSF